MIKMAIPFVIVLFSLISCSSSQEKIGSYTGVYTSHLPRIGPLIRIQEEKHNGKMVPMSAYMVYLRADGAFVMGGCDLQIREAGRYLVEPDSIILTDIYSFRQESKLPDKKFFFDQSSNSIYYRHSNPDSLTYIRYPESIAILELGFIRSHLGFLRNQEMRLDSLLTYNKFLSYDEQMVWVASRLTSKTAD